MSATDAAALARQFPDYLGAVKANVLFDDEGGAYALSVQAGEAFERVHLGHDVPAATRTLCALADQHAKRQADKKPMGRPPTADRAEGVVPMNVEVASDLHATFTALARSRSLTNRAAVDEALRDWVARQGDQS